MKLSVVTAFGCAVLLAVGLSVTSFAGPLPDGDSDGVPDEWDNCLTLANPAQIDSNSDGYGNSCDMDYNNDGGVGAPDFTILVSVFGTSLGSPGYNPDVDCNGDDGVGAPDFTCLVGAFGGAPGPSGLPCAGTVPCTGI